MRRTKEEAPILLEPQLTLANSSCISEQFRDIQEVISLILHYKTMYFCRMTSPTHRVCKWNIFNNQKWIDPRRKKSQRDWQSVFFTAVNPMDDDQSMEEIPNDLDKPRITPYKNTWRHHQKHSALVQFKARSTHCLRFFLRSGMHEDQCWINFFVLCDSCLVVGL